MHVSPYIYRGPTNIAIWEEREPDTRELIAIKHRISTFDQERTIYMDGRPHPPVVRRAHVDGVLDRPVAGQHAGRHDHAHQEGLAAEERRAGKRSGDADRVLRAHRRRADADQRDRRSRVSHRAAGQERGVRPEHAGRPAPRVALQVQAGGRGRPAGGRCAALPAGREHVSSRNTASATTFPESVTRGGAAQTYPHRVCADRSRAGDEGACALRLRHPAK